jgi:hypothetical protein
MQHVYEIAFSSKVSLFPKMLRNFSSENKGNVLISLGQYSREQKTHKVALEYGIYTLSKL